MAVTPSITTLLSRLAVVLLPASLAHAGQCGAVSCPRLVDDRAVDNGAQLTANRVGGRCPRRGSITRRAMSRRGADPAAGRYAAGPFRLSHIARPKIVPPRHPGDATLPYAAAPVQPQ